MNAKQFQEECNSKITGWLWDDSFATDYQHSITLTIKEMRFIENVLRNAEGKERGSVQEWDLMAIEKDDERLAK